MFFSAPQFLGGKDRDRFSGQLLREFLRKSIQDELREFVFPQAAGVSTIRPLTRGSNESGPREPATLPFVTSDLHLGVSGRIGIHIQKIIDRDTAEPQDVESRLHHGELYNSQAPTGMQAIDASPQDPP